jgi:hypothetical protein
VQSDEFAQLLEGLLVRPAADSRVARHNAFDDTGIEDPDLADGGQLRDFVVNRVQLRLMPAAAQVMCAHVNLL